MGKLNFFLVFFGFMLITQATAQDIPEPYNAAVSQTELLHYEEYIETVYEMLVAELLDLGFCNLRMKDYEKMVNETFYGEKIVGPVKFFNGFVNHVEHSVAKDYSYSIGNDSFITVRFVFGINNFNFSYDALGKFDQVTAKGTGFFKMNHVLYTIAIQKHIFTKEITSSISNTVAQPYTIHRLRFHPKNIYTSAMAREFNIFDRPVRESYDDWANVLKPILQKIVVDKVQFPEIDYYTG